MKLYTELAEYYYEIEKPGRNFREEVQFILDFFQKFKITSALDIGCGTGEHTLAIKKSGIKVIGVDSSKEMLDVAKKRHPDCDFRFGKMQDFLLEQGTDGIICMFGTFNYLVTNSEIEKAIHNFRANLKPSGILILEIWNSLPINKIQRKPISPVSMIRVGNTIVKRNRGFKTSSTEELNGENNIVELNFIFHLDEKVIKDKHIMRVFSLDEVKTVLEKNKFEVLNVFGNFGQEKFTQSKGRMILVCKKKG